VWLRAFRRDRPGIGPEVAALIRAIESGETIVTTGMAMHELLQGF